MHHNPLALVKEESDGIGLQQKKEFQQILTKNNNIIKHIFLVINTLQVLVLIVVLLFPPQEVLGLL